MVKSPLVYGGGFASAYMLPGESLLQHVLDDPLLALARPRGGSIRQIKFMYICFSGCNF